MKSQLLISIFCAIIITTLKLQSTHPDTSKSPITRLNNIVTMLYQETRETTTQITRIINNKKTDEALNQALLRDCSLFYSGFYACLQSQRFDGLAACRDPLWQKINLLEDTITSSRHYDSDCSDTKPYQRLDCTIRMLQTILSTLVAFFESHREPHNTRSEEQRIRCIQESKDCCKRLQKALEMNASALKADDPQGAEQDAPDTLSQKATPERKITLHTMS